LKIRNLKKQKNLYFLILSKTQKKIKNLTPSSFKKRNNPFLLQKGKK
tara:strand:- start:2893 stop:3033 length:141 start_codon:yes stop_codon:yes gene_type:complete